MPERPLRIAVVGAGPKALFALEELTAQLDAAPAYERLGVTVIDRLSPPGIGAAYGPDQPPYLRLNVTAAILDAPVTGEFPSFHTWVRDQHPQLGDEPYPPRAVVGEYLMLRWQQMVRGMSRHGTVEHRRAQVTDVHREGGAWHLATDRAAVGPVDEVLIATGHAADHQGALHHHWRSPLPLIPAVLPVERMLSIDRVPPGSGVAVRGGALTFIDACLALTEGRGGSFTASGGDGSSPRASHRLAHVRGDDEPAVIRPITRQGLLLDVKPDPGTPLGEAGDRALEQARSRFGSTACTDPRISPDAVLGVVVDAATMLLSQAVDLAPSVARAAVERTLRTGAEPDLPEGAGRAEAAVRRSVAIAEGSRRPGPAWALGRMWQSLYPLISRTLRGSDASQEDWGRFRHAAQVLERFAFGPPLVNARKLLAMIDSGAVDLSWMDSGVSINADGIHGAPGGQVGMVDAVIDAVLSPPGLLHLFDDLAGSLLRRGLVQVRPGRRGAMVDGAGSPVDRKNAPLVATADGRAVTGLALIGRPTEDHVVGNDSLNRNLHQEGRTWAQRVAERARTAAAGPAIIDHDREEQS